MWVEERSILHVGELRVELMAGLLEFRLRNSLSHVVGLFAFQLGNVSIECHVRGCL